MFNTWHVQLKNIYPYCKTASALPQRRRSQVPQKRYYSAIKLQVTATPVAKLLPEWCHKARSHKSNPHVTTGISFHVIKMPTDHDNKWMQVHFHSWCVLLQNFMHYFWGDGFSWLFCWFNILCNKFPLLKHIKRWQITKSEEHSQKMKRI